MTAYRWPRKLTKAKLAERSIYNTHGLLRDGEPAIVYRPYQPLGWTSFAGWYVSLRNREIPGQPWYTHGAKAFGVARRVETATKLAEAMQWASAQFNVREWVRTPFGSYVPREVAERVVREAGKP